ncbi:TerD family protein [Streptomyces sp. SP18CS02]|uniref:TerD family protein n=1 Tax=Streptomyces sp. SP18CS02 TaxID=3002531 RepID=UPI002E7A8034|nr:TerD family protein [Streptomyces sp. SP18CS02]MEE1751664.1 TerD family protein [Streptomyces sp. SP18CS02]
MSSLNKGVGKVEVSLKWDPSPAGVPDHDLDIIAAVYPADDPHGAPVYLVHFGSRSPDGTITLSRDSRSGLGFGVDEAMTLELNRLSPAYGRVVVGVAIQQSSGRRTFGEISNASVLVREGYTDLQSHDFAGLRDSTAATIVEFTRDGLGGWECRRAVRGFDADPQAFATVMGAPAA